MSKHLIAFLLSLLAWLVASSARAQSTNAYSASVSTKKVESLKTVKEKALTLAIDLSGTTDLEKTDSAESTRATTLGLGLNYKINQDYLLLLAQAISYSNNGSYAVEASNTVLAFSAKPIKLSEVTHLTPLVKALLPTNEDNREYDSFRGAAAASLTLVHKTYLGVPLTISLSEELLKNVHEFESNAGNKANLSYRARTVGSFAFELGDHLDLSLSASYDAGRTYQEALRTAFKASQELSYKFTKSTSTYLSHSNGGDALGANGTESQIKIADDRTSTVSLGFRTVF